MTWVKICGTTSLHDAQLATTAGADALGFIFAPSPRAVDVDSVRAIVRELPANVEKVGVFVNQTACAVAEVAQQAALTGVQLHGDEPPESLAEFRAELGDRKIIKVLHANELLEVARPLDRYLDMRGTFDAILLDSGSAQQRGGTGAAYEWNRVVPIAREIRKAMPLIIAGGLNAENVARAIAWFEPWGVDVVSGVESSPGTKEARKLRDFIAAVRQAPASMRQGA
jgi:phosphoribosylanthranilate isomerase